MVTSSGSIEGGQEKNIFKFIIETLSKLGNLILNEDP
jgi:hypothetical protein